MSSPLDYGVGYKKLGLFEEARRELQRLKPGDEDYVSSWCQLAWLADRTDLAELARIGNEGIAMLSSGMHDPAVVDATANCLHLSGDSLAAYDLTSKYCRVIKWADTTWYGFATYASRCEKWPQAAWLLLLCLKHGGDAHLFFDLDLEPLFHHMALHTPDPLSALALGHPLFTTALGKASSSEVDHVMERFIPPELRPLLLRNAKKLLTSDTRVIIGASDQARIDDPVRQTDFGGDGGPRTADPHERWSEGEQDSHHFIFPTNSFQEHHSW